MKRIIMMLTVAAFMVAALSVSALSALAVSPSQQQCEAQGGTFTRSGGEVRCVIVDEEEGKNPKFTEETTTTTTGQGNISNKQQQQQDQECQQDGQTREQGCPPGQFK